MATAYIFLLLGLLSFAAMGIIHKIGDRRHAQPLPIALYALVAAGVLSSVRVVGTHALSSGSLSSGSLSSAFALPPILLIALPFGAAAGLSLWFFQRGLRYGSIATSWLLINLSAGLPAVLSVLVYREALGWKKVLVLGLIVLALLLLWWDRRNSIGAVQPDVSVAAEGS